MRKGWLWGVGMLPLLATCVALHFLPQEIPAHFGFDGEIDRWGSKYEALILPVCVLLFALFWHLMVVHYEKKAALAKEEKERAEAEANRRVLLIAGCVVLAFQGVLHGVSLYQDFKYTREVVAVGIDSFYTVVGFGVGALLLLTGNLLPKCRRNQLFGLRTKWSMENDETWRLSQRFGGVLWIIAGVICILLAAVLRGIGVLIGILGTLLLATIGAVLVSWVAYRRVLKEGSQEEGLR